MGSWRAAEATSSQKTPVLGMISVETIGYYSEKAGSQKYPFPLSFFYPDTGDFIAFVGNPTSRTFLRSVVRDFRDVGQFPSVGGTAPFFIPGIGWSDHWAYAEHGIPALMVTDTAPFRYPYYHTESDQPDRLDYGRIARVVVGLDQVVRRLSKRATSVK